MKKVVFIILLLMAVLAAAVFFFRPRPEPEQVFRANLTEAQKVLGILRRAEMAYQQSTQSYKDASAKISDGKWVYSDGWRALKLPGVETSSGFDYECVASKFFCRALESEKESPFTSGIQIDIKTGAFSCLGSYKPVTTEGFNGAPVVVACQA